MESKEVEEPAPLRKWKCGQKRCEHAADEPWGGPCPGCGLWANVVKNKRASEDDPKKSIGAMALKVIPRLETGIPGLDRVLGGGLVKGSTALIGGRRGMGKSSMCVWVCGLLAQAGKKVIYASGEESREDVASIFYRQGIFDGLDDEGVADLSTRIIVLGNTTDIYAIVDRAEEEKPALLVVDSLQSVDCEDVKADFGEHAQVKAVAMYLTSQGKRLKLPIFAISQLNSSGDLASGQSAQHGCDMIFQFNACGDPEDPIERSWRMLECDEKNRRGNIWQTAMFNMTETGRLVEIEPPKSKSRRIIEPGDETAKTPRKRLVLVSEVASTKPSHGFNLPEEPES